MTAQQLTLDTRAFQALCPCIVLDSNAHTWKLFAAAQGLCTALSKLHPHSGQEEEPGHSGDAQLMFHGLHHCLASAPALPSTL